MKTDMPNGFTIGGVIAQINPEAVSPEAHQRAMEHLCESCQRPLGEHSLEEYIKCCGNKSKK